MKINCTEQFKILRLNIYLTFAKSICKYPQIYAPLNPIPGGLSEPHFFGKTAPPPPLP